MTLKKIIEEVLIKTAGKSHMDIFEIFRIKAVLPHIKGELLDIGCGFNNLVRNYSGNGIGIDIHDWSGKPEIVVKSTRKLPFLDKSFDTVSFVACLNHIPYREDSLREAARVLKPKGRILITMIGPLAGKIVHFFNGKDEMERGFVKGELTGLTDKYIKDLAERVGFRVVQVRRIFFTANKIFVLEK